MTQPSSGDIAKFLALFLKYQDSDHGRRYLRGYETPEIDPAIVKVTAWLKELTA
jgi:hypothetical protein